MEASDGWVKLTRFLACLGLALTLRSGAAAQATSLVSFDASGQSPSGDAFDPTVSADGRYVTFQWYVPFVHSDVFLCDRLTGAIERISVNSNELPGDSFSYVPTFTPDLRYVAFSSFATNLVVGDTNGPYPSGHDVFVRDRVNGTTERVSVGAQGQQGNDSSYHPAICADGSLVAFTSYATNLVAADSNASADVFVRDRSNGGVELVSVDSGGALANGASFASSISADGRFVVFYGGASNLVAGDTNASADVFIRDRLSGTTERLSVSTSGAQGNANSQGGSISPDGRYVAFHSAASTLVAGDTNGKSDIFLRDRLSGTTERISSGAGGLEASGDSYSAALTPDGRFVAFQSNASNLVAGDTNGRWDVFLRDRLLATTQRMSVDSNGVQAGADSGIQGPSLSADGRYVAFDSHAAFVVADTDNWHDIYLRDRGTQPPSSFCTPATSSNGCSATIAASANPSVSQAGPCSVTVSDADGQRSGLLFYGLAAAGVAPAPWAAGSTSHLCVKAPTQRTDLQNSGGASPLCNGAYALDWNAYQLSTPLALGNPWRPGDRVYVQAWFRDPPAPKSTNLSNALELSYVP